MRIDSVEHNYIVVENPPICERGNSEFLYGLGDRKLWIYAFDVRIRASPNTSQCITIQFITCLFIKSFGFYTLCQEIDK